MNNRYVEAMGGMTFPDSEHVLFTVYFFIKKDHPEDPYDSVNVRVWLIGGPTQEDVERIFTEAAKTAQELQYRIDKGIL